MEVAQAIKSRKSIRAFKPDPVPLATIKEIIELSVRAPSWANTQPWEFAVVTGDKLKQIRNELIEKIGKEETSPDIKPPQVYPEPYDSRRRAAMSKSREAKGLSKGDKEAELLWERLQLTNFGAPCEIYICTERSFYYQGNTPNVWVLFDCGLVAQNIMLLATSHGLGTIPQARAVAYPNTLRSALGIPDSKVIVIGIAIGYPDWDDPVNKYWSQREPLEKICQWYGFRPSV